jgi:hypothetical protein
MLTLWCRIRLTVPIILQETVWCFLDTTSGTPVGLCVNGMSTSTPVVTGFRPSQGTIPERILFELDQNVS